MTFNTRNIILSVLLLISKSIYSASMDNQVEDYMEFLGSTTMMSPLEGAGSHGSIGIGLGMGVGVYSTPENRMLISDQFRDRDEFHLKNTEKNQNSIVVPRVYLHKGSIIPVDIGGYFSKIPNTSATAAGFYGQWTIFEGFALPAVATRFKYSKMMGLPSSEFQSVGAEAVVSYGLFSIFNVYTSLGVNRGMAEIRTSGETGTSLVLDPENRLDSYRVQRDQFNRSLGIQVLFVPAFCTATVETHKVGTTPRSWIAKLSMGI